MSAMLTSSELSELSQTPTPPADYVPDDEERGVGAQQWENQSPTLFTLPKLHSVSKLTPLEFTAMRAVWPKILKADKFSEDLFGPEINKKAREAITNFSELKAYLRQVGQPDTGVVHRDMGAFLLVRDSQKRIPLEPAEGQQWLESDSTYMGPSLSNTREISQPDLPGMASEPDPEMSGTLSSSAPALSDVSAAFNSGITPGPTKDEKIVNNALLLFLRTLLAYQSELKCHWAADRSPFSKATFGDNSMMACTDGYLEANGEVFAIVEVKPHIRDPVKRPEVLWQETGKMIAWIMHDDKHKRKCQLRRRLLVSQDNHEVYLTIADYDNRYLAYLNNGDASCDQSLKMQTYGPWSIAHPSHMEDLAMIILCCFRGDIRSSLFR
ncbi:hypothetical protein N7527_011791 [Penicillium freii]|uniref:Uncharacterized protein n=1 Tax=Penicillium freii TaxID=48697 RepID=A0A101MNW2_PENFR|nr:hypothetical protein N7527_011791 [Penicillium freii]KUM64007.1 hypothetical protein ACN42_g3061 [Penicillium freii]